MPTKKRGKVKITPQIENNLIEESTSQSVLPFEIRKPHIIIIAVILLILVGLFFAKSLFIAATVNNTPISRIAVIRDLEKQGGKQTLEGLITDTLILQEAKKQQVTVDQKEIDDELKKAEAQLAANGQTLDQVLQTRGLTKEGVMQLIRKQKLIEKMIGKDISISDQETDTYIEKNKDSLPQSSDSAKLRQSIKDQLKQQKLSDKYQSWIAELQKNAKINYFVNY